MADRPDPVATGEQVEYLRQRIQRLEDTVLYLSNTLAMHGLINDTEAGVARGMRREAQRVVAEEQRLRWGLRRSGEQPDPRSET